MNEGYCDIDDQFSVHIVRTKEEGIACCKAYADIAVTANPFIKALGITAQEFHEKCLMKQVNMFVRDGTSVYVLDKKNN